MSTISLRLPESLHKQLRTLAKSEGISINQLAATALAEKIAALMTEDYLAQRAERASRERFDNALSRIQNIEPLPEDKI